MTPQARHPRSALWAVAALAVVLAIGSQAGADPRPRVRIDSVVRVPGGSARPRSPAALQRSVRSAYPGVDTDSAVSGHRLLERVRREPSATGMRVRQTLRAQGNKLVLSTSISARARESAPALVTAVRRFPTAVLVQKTRRGYVLQGPVLEGASPGRQSQRPVFQRIEVRPDGATTVELLDARTQKAVAGSKVLASRNWSAHPAIVERPTAPLVYAISDIHGGYDRLLALLTRHGLVARAPSSPEAVRWTAGRAKLVVVGDLINRGPQSVEVLDLVRALQSSARQQGGEVIVTLGNHEAGFLLEPEGRTGMGTDGTARELRTRGIDPRESASPRDPRGQWLRDLPFAARIGRWLFAHSGDTGGRTLAEMERSMRSAVDVHDYDHPEVRGRDSILRSVGWHQRAPRAVRRNARAADVDHVVFGHDPRALGRRGQLAVGRGGELVRIDTGLAAENGALLRLTTARGRTVAEALRQDGTIEELWAGRSDRGAR